MLDLADGLELPAGVRLQGGAVVDDVRGARFPANATAVDVLRGAGEPLAVTADRLATRFGLDRDAARDDVLAFAWSLSGALLVNVRPSRSRLSRSVAWGALALRLLPLGRLPACVPRRHHVDTTTVARATASCASALAGRVALLGGALTIGLAALWLVAGDTDLREPAVLAAATGIALLLHEVGHAVALVRVPAALVLDGPRTLVLHRVLPVARARAVAVTGPAGPALVGVVLVSAGLLLDDSLLALASCPLGGHALGLTIASGDGRTACGL